MSTSDDKAQLEAIVRDMAAAQNADEIMKHWAQDIAWFDISAANLRGYEAVHAEFDRQFGKLEACGAEFIEFDVHVSGDLGIVRSVQKFWATTKEGEDHNLMTRQTDCFARRNGRWEEFHQHISLPIAG